MKKPVKKMGSGGLAMISPAAALVQSLQKGQPEGLMRYTPLGMAMGYEDEEEEKRKRRAAGTPATGMKKGGKVSSMRGCGCAIRGTKGGKMV
jgi:hypothetical protein